MYHQKFFQEPLMASHVLWEQFSTERGRLFMVFSSAALPASPWPHPLTRPTLPTALGYLHV